MDKRDIVLAAELFFNPWLEGHFPLMTAGWQAYDNDNQKQGEENKNKKKQRKKSGGSVCFCGNPGCGIGPFVEQN